MMIMSSLRPLTAAHFSLSLCVSISRKVMERNVLVAIPCKIAGGGQLTGRSINCRRHRFWEADQHSLRTRFSKHKYSTEQTIESGATSYKSNAK